MALEKTWRWFGANDTVKLTDLHRSTRILSFCRNAKEASVLKIRINTSKNQLNDTI